MRKLLMIALLCTSCTTYKIHGVSNLAEVSPGIYRGGQPNAEGWAYLKSLGVTKTIKLNTVGEGTDTAAETNGIAVTYLPIGWSEQWLFKPDAGMIHYAVTGITSNTFIHCLHGQDRTGLIVGIYRLQHDHWKRQDAWDEMINNGFHPYLFGLWRCWRAQ